MKEENNNRKDSGKKKWLKTVLVIAFLLFLCIVLLLVRDRNKKNIQEKAENNENTIMRYIDSINKCSNEEVQSVVSGGYSYLMGELDYQYSDNHKKIIRQIFSKVSVNIISNNGSDVVEVNMRYLDYDSIYDRILSDKKKIYKDSKKYRDNTPRDIYNMQSYAESVILKYLEESTSTTESVFDVSLCDVRLSNKDSNTESGRCISNDTDEYIDNLLFNSDSFHNMLDLVSAIINKSKVLDRSDISSENTYDSIKGFKRVLEYTDFCCVEKINRGETTYIGDGSQSRPISLGHDVETLYLDSNGANSIFIRVNEVLEGEEAVKYVNMKHDDNRGITSSSSMKLIIVKYTVTNLTDRKMKIKSKLALSDSNGNLAKDNGRLYGLKTTGTLKPYKKLNLEYYTFNENPDLKSLVWGSDFERNYEYVWFNCLNSNGNKSK